TINIAFIKNGLPAAGFIFVPVTGLAFVAEKTQGAFRINPDGSKTLLRSRPFHLMEKGIRVVASRSHMNEETERCVNRLNDPQMISIGSSLKFLLIAEGKADFYPRFGPTMEWDTGAAQCILEEAGGAILQTKNFFPLE